MNEILKAISERRSIRGYSDVQLTDEQIAALVQAAQEAPSARNSQAWHFTVVKNKQIIDDVNDDLMKIFAAEGKKFPDGYHVFFNAPTVIFVSYDLDKKTNPHAHLDAGIATENICLAAHGLGLGSVIIGYVRPVFELEPTKSKYEKLLAFPENYGFGIAIAIGNPTMGKEAHPIHEGRVTYID